MLHLIALAGLLVSLVFAEAASQPPKKSLLAFNRERCDFCRWAGSHCFGRWRGVWPVAMTQIWKAIRLLVLTSLKADIEIRRFA